ncbi:MAG: hypothetical protein EXR51_07290 [Dehalococcoidia bacterium]|nr:hypothetical protein [Dehalococcoidia bacterium]
MGSGKIAQILEKLMADIKPEAAYMYPVDGQRGGHVIVNMADSSELAAVAAVAERFWIGLKAHVTMTPVMNAEDLQKGLAGMGEIVKRFG